MPSTDAIYIDSDVINLLVPHLPNYFHFLTEGVVRFEPILISSSLRFQLRSFSGCFFRTSILLRMELHRMQWYCCQRGFAVGEEDRL